MSSNNNSKIEDMDIADFVKKLYDFTWEVADFIRDKRHTSGEGKKLHARADVPKDLVEKTVWANKLCSRTLCLLAEMSLDSVEDSDDPGEVIGEITFSKDMIQREVASE